LLRDRALQHKAIDEVILINEESECGCCDDEDAASTTTKHSCYATALAEKETRGTLKSAFDRAVGATMMSPQQRRRRLVILDSLNYIKGFRYELHCISKAAGEIHGVLWVLNKPHTVKEWNSKRQEQGHGGYSYSSELLQELILRYEPPDERNRWDKPLFTVDMALWNNGREKEQPGEESSAPNQTTSKSEVLQRSVYNMHALGEVLGTSEGAAACASATDSSTTAQQSGDTQQPWKPSKSAFQRSTKKSAFQRRAKPKAKEQHAFTPDDLKALETVEGDTGGLTSLQLPESADESLVVINVNDTSLSQPQLATPTTLEEQLDQILDVFLLQTKALKEGISTRQHVAGQANVLQSLDWISAQLISTIATASMSQQGSVVANADLMLTFHGTDNQPTLLSMKCMRPVALPELRQLRKMYLQWGASHPPSDTTEIGIAQSFVEYVEEHLQ
jgi:protein KTI12